MRLGVEAAVVDGVLAPGRRRDRRRPHRRRGLGGGAAAGPRCPGFVDLQVNGFGGVDFASADAAGYRRAGEALLETGVTAFQPTLITAPEEDLVAALARGARRAGRRRGSSASISKGRSSRRPGSAPIPRPPGAIPTARLLERLLAAGPVVYMTLAPELPGALELVDAPPRARHRRLVRPLRRDRGARRIARSTAASGP